MKRRIYYCYILNINPKKWSNPQTYVRLPLIYTKLTLLNTPIIDMVNITYK